MFHYKLRQGCFILLIMEELEKIKMNERNRNLLGKLKE